MSCGVYNRTRYYYNEVVMRVCNVVTSIRAIVQAIDLGKHCRFYGLPMFVQRRGGYIKIGNNCEFRSRKYSNLVGLDHACILSATPAYKRSVAQLIIGDNCGMSGVSIWCFKEIVIGNNVRIGANTLIMDGDAHYEDPRTTPPCQSV